MNLKLCGIAVAVAFAFATAAQAQNNSTRKVKEANEERIESEYKLAKEKCDAMQGNQKDICVAQAKGKQKVAKAELDAKHANDPAKARRKVEEAKAEAAYDVAKQRCDEKKGNEKDVCMKQAKVERDRAKVRTAKTAVRDERPAASGQTRSQGSDKPARY